MAPAPRYRSKLVLKLFPSIPKGVFGDGRLTALFERHVFYREFQFSPWRLAAVAGILAAIAAWSVGSLLVSWQALHRTDVVRQGLEERERQLEQARRGVAAARRDYLLLLSRLQPLETRVERLGDFSSRLATVAGVEGLVAELGAASSDGGVDVLLSEEQVAELDWRFARLGSYLESQEVQLARTPSISPLKLGFVPTDRFGYRSSRFLRQAEGHGGDGKQFHAGLDLAAPVGTPIHASADGVVHFAGSIPPRQSPAAALYGNFVVIDHGNGIRTVYAHCDDLAVRQGERIPRGHVIGWVGSTGRSTGPHLHYEVVVNGRPMDPETFVLDVDIPDRRVQVDFEDHPSLVDEVDRLLGL